MHEKISDYFPFSFGFQSFAQNNFSIGTHIGLPISDTSDISSVNVGLNVSYLYNITSDFKLGASPKLVLALQQLSKNYSDTTGKSTFAYRFTYTKTHVCKRAFPFPFFPSAKKECYSCIFTLIEYKALHITLYWQNAGLNLELKIHHFFVAAAFQFHIFS